MTLTSRERLLKTFRGEQIDRVPISLYEFDGFYHGWIHDHPEYVEILEYAEGKTDKMYFWNAPSSGKNILFFGELESGSIQKTDWQEGTAHFSKTMIQTPAGELTRLSRQDEGIHTGWCLEHLCKDEKDAEKVLSLPFVPWQPSVESFFEADKKLGGAGILLGDIADALCNTVELFGFSTFLMLYLDNPDLVFRLMDFFQERILAYMEHILENGAVTLYRIVGPEYATPPYLSPQDFDKLVTPYDKELVDLLHTYDGLARLHSHGNIRQVLASFKEMGIDATDPIEPPPDGDIELAEVREVLADVVLIGNIEERLFEIRGKEEIDIAVQKAIEGGRGGGFILCPTSMPLTTPLDRKIKENIIHYIDAGVEYGQS